MTLTSCQQLRKGEANPDMRFRSARAGRTRTDALGFDATPDAEWELVYGRATMVGAPLMTWSAAVATGPSEVWTTGSKVDCRGFGGGGGNGGSGVATRCSSLRRL